LFVASLGWFGVMLAATADGILEIWSLPNEYYVWTVCGLGAAMTATAGLGNRVILYLNKASMPLLLFAVAFLFYELVSPETNGLNVAYTPTGEMSFRAMLNLIIAGYLVGAVCSSDFSRYAKDNRAQWIGSFLGVWGVSVLLSIIALYAKYFTGQWNPLKAVYFSGLGYISVSIIILSAWTTNHALLYSAGLALTRLFNQKRPLFFTGLAGAVGTAMGLSGRISNLESFLTALGYFIPGILGCLLAHYYLIVRHGEECIGIHLRGFLLACLMSTVCAVLSAESWVPSLVSVFVGAAVYGAEVLYLPAG